MKGYRKVFISLIIIFIAATRNISEHQADVLIAVAGFMLGANAISNIGGQIAKEMGKRNHRRFRSVTSVSGNPERPWENGSGSGENPRQDVSASEWDREGSW